MALNLSAVIGHRQRAVSDDRDGAAASG